MSETMVERAGKRLFEKAEHLDPTLDEKWEDLRERDREFWRLCARAVIAEMREPDQAMVDTAWRMLRSNLRYEEVYRHMVDAALSESMKGE